jgi:outer membrane protein with beta-barrel domain
MRGVPHRAFALALVAGLAATAVQPAVAAVPSAGADLSGGYSYTHAGEADLHGWGLSASYPIRGSLRLLADVSGHYGSFAGADLNQLGLLGGARYGWGKGRLRPFADALLGGVRTSVSVGAGEASVSDADTDWGVAFGGGVDYELSTRWALRGLLHLRLLKGEGAWDTDPRLSIGVAYRLSR